MIGLSWMSGVTIRTTNQNGVEARSFAVRTFMCRLSISSNNTRVRQHKATKSGRLSPSQISTAGQRLDGRARIDAVRR